MTNPANPSYNIYILVLNINVVPLSLQEEVTIQYVKLHADPKEGKTLDIGTSFSSVTFNSRQNCSNF